MKITFLVPCKDLAGGLKVVTAYGNALLRRGHEVTVIYPKRMFPLKEKLRKEIKGWLNDDRDHLDFFQGKLLEVEAITEENIPSADILIATAWQTVEESKDFDSSKGKKFYFIQHYETTTRDTEETDKSYKRKDFTKIVISNYLKKTIEKVSGEKNIAIIPNGRDYFLSEYKGEGFNRKYAIGMLYSSMKSKRSDIGMESINIVLDKYPDLKVVLFGSEYTKERLNSQVFTFYRRPLQEEIPKIYLSTRIWISSSDVEGFCLPALEAICSGCAVVTTNSGGVLDIIEDGKTGLVVSTGNAQLLADAIIKVLENKELEIKFQNAGLSQAENFSWEKSTNQLEKLLKEYISR